MRVLVVGAGLSDLVAAQRLQENLDVTGLEVAWPDRWPGLAQALADSLSS